MVFKSDACSDISYLTTFQDPFKYSYPPLPDDDFQTPICDNGPIVSEDETESKEGETESKDALESSFNSEVVVKPKKVHFLSGLYPSAKINQYVTNISLQFYFFIIENLSASCVLCRVSLWQQSVCRSCWLLSEYKWGTVLFIYFFS